MSMKIKPLARVALSWVVLSLGAAAGPAFATNGMNLEGYGANSAAMGGAGMAFDTGNSAVMNNPATLGFMPSGKRNLGLGLTVLGPDVNSSVNFMGMNMNAESGGDSYLMPSLSFMYSKDRFVSGLAVMAQGGMGTEYGSNSFLSLSGKDIRSEVGVGRVMVPFVYRATDRLNLAAELDYVWATMDLRMDLSGAQLEGLAKGMGGSASGPFLESLGMQVGGVDNVSDYVNYARFDFSDDNDFNGEATGQGFAGKLGFTYKVDDKLAVGASYHSKTALDDMEAGSAMLEVNVATPQGNMAMPVPGKLTILDFEWPAKFAVGMSYKVNDKWLLAADLARVMWNDVMDEFRMSFVPGEAAGPLAGTYHEFTLKQGWKDQTVVGLGVQYRVAPNFVVRGGVNYAENPIPDEYVNPLFPAITEWHYTLGFGWSINPRHRMAAALTYAPEVSVTNPGFNLGGTDFAPPVDISHSQLNWRINYTYLF